MSQLKTKISASTSQKSEKVQLKDVSLKDVSLKDYMKLQPKINTEMRKVLVNWMLKIHVHFLLRPETYFTAVRILDTFSNKVKIGRTRYQLVGMGALFIAAKSVEIEENVPNPKSFAWMTNNVYKSEEIFLVERLILKHRNYTPTIFQILMMYADLFRFNTIQVIYTRCLTIIATKIYKLAIIKQNDVALTCIYMTMKKFKLFPQIVEKYYIKSIYDMIVSERDLDDQWIFDSRSDKIDQ